MKTGFRYLLSLAQAMYSPRELTALQEDRGLTRFLLNKRSRGAVILAAILLLSLMTYLLSIAWQRQSTKNYIETRARILTVAQTSSHWKASPVVADEKGDIQGLYNNLVPRLAPMDGSSLASTKLLSEIGAGEEKAALLVRVTLSKQQWQPLLVLNRDLIVSFPRVLYNRAALFVDGKYSGMFLASNRIGIPFDSLEYGNESVVVDVLFQDNYDLTDIFKQVDEPMFVTTAAEYRGFLRFSALGENTKLTWLSDTAIVVLAVFLLVLFLFVDSSTETLGMALYLGFSALSISIDYGWLPVVQRAAYGIYLYEMSVIFRFYFILQLARVVGGGVGPWFVVGSLMAIPYAYFTGVVVMHDSPWLDWYEASRDIVLCLLSVSICARVILHLRGKKLPWRVAALSIAAVASMQQLMSPIEFFVPALEYNDAYTNWFYIVKHASVFLLAMSAFVNISALEKRVKTLSVFQTRQQIMNKELELAQSVQTAFMTVPKFPSTFQLITQHDAQMRVSGDSFFVDWNEQQSKFTVILNDVTGHGIQAALKASVCQVVSKMIWQWVPSNGEMKPQNKIVEYEQRLRHFFKSVQDSPDVVAFVACEMDEKTGQVDIYRANFTFPFLISQVKLQDGFGVDASEDKPYWNAELLAMPNQEMFSMRIAPGSFLLFMSDGYIGGSRDAYALLKLLRQQLAGLGSEVTAQDLKKIILSDPRLNRSEVEDDRTFVIVQWMPESVDLSATRAS